MGETLPLLSNDGKRKREIDKQIRVSGSSVTVTVVVCGGEAGAQCFSVNIQYISKLRGAS